MTDVTINAATAKSRPKPNVFFWSADKYGAGYYRMALPGIGLHMAYDWTVQADMNLQDHYLTWDLVVAQRACQPGTSAMMDFMRQAGMPMVYEIDDLLTQIHPSNTRDAVTVYNNPVIRKLMIKNMRDSDAITVSTEPLQREFSEYNDNVYVLPNCVDERAFRLERMERVTDKPVIGWAGGSSHKSDIKIIAKAIEQVTRDNDVMWHTIGMKYQMDVPPDAYLFTSWSDSIIDYYTTLNFDIGVAPIESHAFNECKSDIKVIEYGIFGIPTVASKFGPYERLIKHGETGFLARNHREWVKYIELLIHDEELRLTMGKAAHEQTKERTIQANIHKWESLYSKLIDRRQVDGQEVMARVKHAIESLTDDQMQEINRRQASVPQFKPVSVS